MIEHTLSQGGHIPELNILHMFKSLCDAIVAFHSLDPPLAHRDIKVGRGCSSWRQSSWETACVWKWRGEETGLDQNTHQHFSFSWYPRVDNLGRFVLFSSNSCNQPLSVLPWSYSLLIEVDERSKISQRKYK